MDKYTKAVLTVIALCVLALPAKAEEKIWYCEMTSVKSKNQFGGGKVNEGERFTVRISNTEVVFGTTGYFHHARMRVVEVNSYGLVTARSEIGYLFFLKSYGDFLLNGPNHTILASCEGR